MIPCWNLVTFLLYLSTNVWFDSRVAIVKASHWVVKDRLVQTMWNNHYNVLHIWFNRMLHNAICNKAVFPFSCRQLICWLLLSFDYIGIHSYQNGEKGWRKTEGAHVVLCLLCADLQGGAQEETSRWICRLRRVHQEVCRKMEGKFIYITN